MLLYFILALNEYKHKYQSTVVFVTGAYDTYILTYVHTFFSFLNFLILIFQHVNIVLYRWMCNGDERQLKVMTMRCTINGCK